MKVLFLADASNTIGTGHGVRSLVLASELCQLNIQAAVAGTDITRIASSALSLQEVTRIELVEAFSTRERLDLIGRTSPDLVILDGYEYAADLFEEIERMGIKYGIIDDYGKTNALNPSFIVNQNPSANADLYNSRFPMSKIFLGLEYCLIRREVRDARRSASEHEHAMVSLGGSDPLNLSLPVSRVLSELNIVTKVALGPLVSGRDLIVAQLERLSEVSLIRQDEFVEALSTSRFAVLGAGSTLWEAAYLAKPTIGIIVAQNQASTRFVSRNRNPKLWYLETGRPEELSPRFETLFKNLIRLHASGSFEVDNELRPERISLRLDDLTRFIITKSLPSN